MKSLLRFTFFWLLSSTVVAEDKPVDAAGVEAMGQVINSVPEHNCTPTEAMRYRDVFTFLLAVSQEHFMRSISFPTGQIRKSQTVQLGIVMI